MDPKRKNIASEETAVVSQQTATQSLKAYSAWISRMVKALAGRANDDMSEEEWIRNWKNFWKQAKQ